MRHANTPPDTPLGSLPGAGIESDRQTRSVRHLLEVSAIPFVTAEYARRSVIFRQGDAADDVLHIEDGRALLSVLTRSGKEAICGLLETGAFLGDEAFMGHPLRRHTAVAVTRITLLVIAKADWRRLFDADPGIADRLIEHLLAREARLEEDLTDQLLYPAEQRLARTLLVLAGCDARRPSRGVLPDIPQEMIAEMVGTTRSRVNGFIGKFKSAGFIEEHDGRLYVCPSRQPEVGGEVRGVAGAAIRR